MTMANENEKQLQLRDETVSRIIVLQEHELELRAREIGIREKEVEREGIIAKESIQAQSNDSKDGRKHKRTIIIAVLIASSIILLSVVAFMFYCVHENKDQLAMEIIKYVGTFLIGGFGGYAIGNRKSSAKNNTEE